MKFEKKEEAISNQEQLQIISPGYINGMPHINHLATF
jgi:hypothetical protein